MSTTLLEAEVLLSKELGDYWSSVATSNGATDGTTLIDALLKAKADDWITDNTYDMITSGDQDEEERKILSLDNDTGLLTMFAHDGQIVDEVTYRIHRLFTASEKRLALIDAAKSAFPYIFKSIRDENKTAEDWLRNGGQEEWASASYADYWRASDCTAAKNTTAPYYYRGSASAQLSGSSGYYHQSNSQVPELMDLAGKSVTFKCKGYASAASSLRLAIYDGATLTYSSFHDGDSAEASLSVTATIAASPSQVSFRAYYTTGATVYVDDFRVVGPTRDKIYIGDLGLALDYPHQIRQSSDSGINEEPWQLLRDYEIDSDGFLYCADWSQEYRLRIKGIGYLDFVDTSGVVGTDWDDDSIDIDEPQTKILVAQAAMYLCSQMVMPNWETGETNMWASAYRHWERELAKRKAKFGMSPPPATTHFGYRGGGRWKSRYGRTNY